MQFIKPALQNLSNLIEKRSNCTLALNLSKTLCHKTNWDEMKMQGHQFHTTSSRRVLDLEGLKVASHVATIAAVLFGRFVRWRWKKLSPETKSQYISTLKSSKYIVLASGILILLPLWQFYYSHLQFDNITRRNKFILYTKDQVESLTDDALKHELKRLKHKILWPSDPNRRRTEKVFKQLIRRNNDIEEINSVDWKIIILDVDDLPSAFLMPVGHVFVLSSTVDSCRNDDQLSIIISHEIAHEILDHVAEEISIEVFTDMMHVLLILFIWTFMPFYNAAVIHYVSHKSKKLLIELPMSRIRELEADKIGLFLAAKACYDVREAIPLWTAYLDDSGDDYDWNSTHPDTKKRIALLKTMLPHAIWLRREHDCPELPPDDPTDPYDK